MTMGGQGMMTPSPRSRKGSIAGESASPSQILFTHEEIVVLKLLFSLFDRGGKVGHVEQYCSQTLACFVDRSHFACVRKQTHAPKSAHLSMFAHGGATVMFALAIV